MSTIQFSMILRGKTREVMVGVHDFIDGPEVDWVDVEGIGEADLEPEECMEIAERVQYELDLPDDIECYKARRALEDV